eukprot:EG_transcript_13631
MEDCDLFDLQAMYPEGWDSALDLPAAAVSHSPIPIPPAAALATSTTPASSSSPTLGTPITAFSPLLHSPLSPQGLAPGPTMSFCWLHSKKRAIEFLQEITPGSGQYRCMPGNECKFAEHPSTEEAAVRRKASSSALSSAPASPPAASVPLAPWDAQGSPRAESLGTPPHPTSARRVSFELQRPLSGAAAPFSPAMDSQSSSIGATSPDQTPTAGEPPREGCDQLEEAIDEFILRMNESALLGEDDGGPDGLGDPDADGKKPRRGKKKRKVPAEDNPAIDPARYKTKLCKNWQLHEKCCYGPRCLFAHGHREIRSYGQPAPRGPGTGAGDRREPPRVTAHGSGGSPPYPGPPSYPPPYYGGSGGGPPPPPYNPVAYYQMPPLAGGSLLGPQPAPYFVYGA